MKKQLRFSALCITLISVSVTLTPISSFAKTSLFNHAYDNGYDDGYEDGYDDAMDKCPCPPRLTLGGFYAGLSAGYEGYQINRNPWIMEDQFGKFNTHANGWNGRLFGGYGRYFDRYYLGGELFLGTSGANGKDTINTTNLQYDGKFSVGTSIGASLLPGYKFDNGPLTYLRLGYISTDLKVNDASRSNSSSTSNWTSGFNTGIGIEIPLYKKIDARLEYDYINYSSFNNNNANVGSKSSPSDNRGSIDLTYHFN
ncbi:MAG: outer membrane beta-barrel protein [Gammaproteobacteria bacterium]|nr:outer membrane beta-barrel protein [Gammaproteobacteria bacterium]